MVYIYQKNMEIQNLQTHSKLLEIESRLGKHPYLSKKSLPDHTDAAIFLKLCSASMMPTKEKYFNFYHWYVLMSQFAKNEIQNWIKLKKQKEEDCLIQDCLLFIDSLAKMESPVKNSQTGAIAYSMNIFVRRPVDQNIPSLKKKLLSIRPDNLGEQLSIKFRGNQERRNQYQHDANELRITFQLHPQACSKLGDFVSKCEQVENIQIKRRTKYRRQ